MAGWLTIILTILWERVMPIIGVLSILGIMFIMLGDKIPVGSIRDKLGRRLIGRGSRILGKTLILIKDEDGLWTLKPATYDSDNNGYWVPTSDGREFYDASGVGGDPGGFYGGSALAVAYDGLGSLSTVAGAEVGRQARIKRKTYAEDLASIDYAKYKAGETSKDLLAGAGDAIRRALVSGDDAATDGGVTVVEDDETTVVGEWETLLPTRKVVDLRDTLDNAPFQVRPQQFHRVAENAKKGQQGFASLGPLGQAGIIMSAFILGAIACYVGFSATGGGGGGAGISIPMGMLSTGVLG
ncbi:hypothetical protein [Halarchaeum salinum]|uniref:Uncharacterized protein n=1 Tax=Halarchaeum salinum TaxID=489912 RepID=A0AAV3S919_9EURY